MTNQPQRKGQYRQNLGHEDARGPLVVWEQFDCPEHPNHCILETIGGIKYCFPVEQYSLGEVINPNAL
jgi:hypothetical protein